MRRGKGEERRRRERKEGYKHKQRDMCHCTVMWSLACTLYYSTLSNHSVIAHHLPVYTLTSSLHNLYQNEEPLALQSIFHHQIWSEKKMTEKIRN